MKILGFEFGKSKKEELTQQDFYDHKNLLPDGFKIKYDYTIPQSRELVSGRGYVYFGPDNLYPDFLNELYHTSALHSSLLDFKKILTVGQGFEFYDQHLIGMDKVQFHQMLNRIDGKNSFDDFLNLIGMNYWVHSRLCFEIHWNKEFTKVLKIKLIPTEKIRDGEVDKFGNINNYYYCWNWKELGKYSIRKIPTFDENNKTDQIQLYVWQSPTPGYNYYTLPNYSSASNWIYLDGRISNYHKSNIENSINPSFAIKFYKKPANNEERQQVLENIERNFGGSSNAGKAMVFFSDGKETAPDIDAVPTSDLDKQFEVTANEIQRNILYAHKVNPLIFGLKTPGSLGNGAEMEISYEIFNNAVIKPAQKDIENIINFLFSLNGLDVDFKLNNDPLFIPIK